MTTTDRDMQAAREALGECSSLSHTIEWNDCDRQRHKAKAAGLFDECSLWHSSDCPLSHQDEVAAAIAKAREEGRKEAALDIRAKVAPHMCRDGHDEVRHWGDDERCPVCLMRDNLEAERDALKAKGERLAEACGALADDHEFGAPGSIRQDHLRAARAALAAWREGAC